MNRKNLNELSLLIAFVIGLVIGFNFGQAGVSIPVSKTPQIPENTAALQVEPSSVAAVSDPTVTSKENDSDIFVEENGKYDTKDEVALYIHKYGHLPYNYITRAKAKKAGWEGGSLERFYPGSSIGGDIFRNREGLLPKTSGRVYYECDIEATGKRSRGAKRIVFSNDGLIYYTGDHYESFTLLYGEDQP